MEPELTHRKEEGRHILKLVVGDKRFEMSALELPTARQFWGWVEMCLVPEKYKIMDQYFTIEFEELTK